SVAAFLKTVLEKDDERLCHSLVKAMSLSNNIVSRRIYEMSEDIEIQLVEKLKIRSILRAGETVLITYVRYIDKGEIAEEVLFCKSLESITTVKDI
ncbi:unnamed protein product, partial [Lymnaea stagnalis]